MGPITPRAAAGAAALAAAALAALWWTWGGPAPQRDAGAVAPHARAGEPGPRPALAPAPAPADPAVERPETRAYREELAFRDQVREFFDRTRELGPAEREAGAAAVRAGIEARERDRRLLPAEALLLKLALASATEEDPSVLQHEIAELMESYAESTPTAAVPDPRDLLYRERQAEIAREVMALEEVPDGLSREAYLRERLRELRLEVYTGGEPVAPEPAD